MEARQIARVLVESRLAACVNIMPNMSSVYRWKDTIEESLEFLLIIKTSRDLLEEVRLAVSRIHSYELPEIIALPIIDGSAAYLDWLADGLKERAIPR